MNTPNSDEEWITVLADRCEALEARLRLADELVAALSLLDREMNLRTGSFMLKASAVPAVLWERAGKAVDAYRAATQVSK